MRSDRALSAFALPRAAPFGRRVTRKQQQPDAIRLFYFASLRALMSKAHARVTAELLPLVHELRPDHVDADDRERMRAKAREIADQFSKRLIVKPFVTQVAQRTASFQKAQLQAQLKDAISVAPFIRDAALEGQIAQFTRENVALIKTVPERYFAGIETMVIDKVEAGTRATTIAKQLEERYSVAESDAALIANDQVGKFYGELNRTRQTELGIRGYVWTTAHDNRVRDNHEELDGTAVDWDDPPEGGGTDNLETGHPGSGINCRCQAIPDVSGLL